MDDLTSALTKTVSITNFNKGMAGKIFQDVKENGAKVVIKNNNPECVLVSPDEYLKMVEAINEYGLLLLAIERNETINPQSLLKQEEVLKQLDITNDDLKTVKVDIKKAK